MWFLASLERINDKGKNYVTRSWFLSQHNDSLLFYVPTDDAWSLSAGPSPPSARLEPCWPCGGGGGCVHAAAVGIASPLSSGLKLYPASYP